MSTSASGAAGLSPEITNAIVGSVVYGTVLLCGFVFNWTSSSKTEESPLAHDELFKRLEEERASGGVDGAGGVGYPSQASHAVASSEAPPSAAAPESSALPLLPGATVHSSFFTPHALDPSLASAAAGESGGRRTGRSSVRWEKDPRASEEAEAVEEAAAVDEGGSTRRDGSGLWVPPSSAPSLAFPNEGRTSTNEGEGEGAAVPLVTPLELQEAMGGSGWDAFFTFWFLFAPTLCLVGIIGPWVCYGLSPIPSGTEASSTLSAAEGLAVASSGLRPGETVVHYPGKTLPRNLYQSWSLALAIVPGCVLATLLFVWWMYQSARQERGEVSYMYTEGFYKHRRRGLFSQEALQRQPREGEEALPQPGFAAASVRQTHYMVGVGRDRDSRTASLRYRLNHFPSRTGGGQSRRSRYPLSGIDEAEGGWGRRPHHREDFSGSSTSLSESASVSSSLGSSAGNSFSRRHGSPRRRHHRHHHHYSRREGDGRRSHRHRLPSERDDGRPPVEAAVVKRSSLRYPRAEPRAHDTPGRYSMGSTARTTVSSVGGGVIPVEALPVRGKPPEEVTRDDDDDDVGGGSVAAPQRTAPAFTNLPTEASTEVYHQSTPWQRQRPAGADDGGVWTEPSEEEEEEEEDGRSSVRVSRRGGAEQRIAAYHPSYTVRTSAASPRSQPPRTGPGLTLHADRTTPSSSRSVLFATVPPSAGGVEHYSPSRAFDDEEGESWRRTPPRHVTVRSAAYPFVSVSARLESESEEALEFGRRRTANAAPNSQWERGG